MAGMGPAGAVGVSAEDEWKTQSFRMKVVAQIDDAVHAAGNPTQKSSREMEKHVFQKARNREEYLALVARLILHMRDYNAKKDGHAGKMQPSQQQDPMAALRGLSLGQPGPGPRPTQQPTPPLQPNPALGAPHPQLSQVQQTQQQLQINLARQQQAAVGQLSMQRQQQLQRQLQNQLAGPPPPAPSMPQQSAMQAQQMFNTQQAAALQQAQQIQNMQAQSEAQQQAMKQTFQMQNQMTLQAQQVAQQNAQRQQQQQAASIAAAQASLQAQQAQQARPPVSPYGGHPYLMSPQSAGAQQPSPSAQSSQPMASPVSYMHPSPSSQHPVPSPVGSRGPPSVPSPVGGLSTPGNPSSVGPGSVGAPGSVGGPGSVGPGSVGAVPSPGGRSRTPQNAAQAEHQAYYEKWKQLSIYQEPLQRMINKASREGDSTKDVSLSKMKNLLEILSDPNKKVTLKMLLRCEQVLVKMDFNKQIFGSTPNSNSSNSSTPPVNPMLSSKPQNMCQPLLEAIAQHIKSPVLNHTLHRTYGPAMNAIHGSPLAFPNPPAKKRKLDTETSPTGGVPNIVQGEVARLPTKFRVNLDPAHHTGGKDIHLVCKLEDKRLPSVPPIAVTVPENYPEVSPQYDTSAQDYAQTTFLASVHRNLHSQIMRLPDKYSLTQVLDSWEMSIRKACINLTTV